MNEEEDSLPMTHFIGSAAVWGWRELKNAEWWY
jgi:hypothetical protein